MLLKDCDFVTLLFVTLLFVTLLFFSIFFVVHPSLSALSKDGRIYIFVVFLHDNFSV